jgi:Chorismate mutase
MTSQTSPASCQTLEQVRAGIDAVDERIVSLIAERGRFVRQAARFKKDAQAVRAPNRYAALLARVRRLAEQQAIDPDLIESVYRTMVDAFIAAELREHAQHVESRP